MSLLSNQYLFSININDSVAMSVRLIFESLCIVHDLNDNVNV